MSHRTNTSIRLAAAREHLGRHREQLMTLMLWALALIALAAALLAQTDTPSTPASAPAPTPAASAIPPPPPTTATQPDQQAPRQQTHPPTPQPAQPSTQRTYQVGFGDTLAQIALRHNVDYQRIAADNQLTDPNQIRPGQTLNIGQPTPGVQLIRPGDTLTHLSTTTGSTARELRALNPWITNPNRIPAGAGLRVRR